MANPHAFPQSVSTSESNVTASHDFEDGQGMTLREYFAAHAPTVQPWFLPTMPPEPTSPPDEPSFPADFSARAEDRNYIINLARKWKRDPCFDLVDAESLSCLPETRDYQNGLLAHACEELDNYETAWKAYWKADSEWHSEFEKQRLIQWPWAYADAVLAAAEVQHASA